MSFAGKLNESHSCQNDALSCSMCMQCGDIHFKRNLNLIIFIDKGNLLLIVPVLKITMF